MPGFTSWKYALRDLFRDALGVSLTLFKIMVPVVVGVRILQALDLIRYLAMPLSPVMRWVGLPPEMGLVWATAMLNNLYSAMVVFLSLAPTTPVSAAQATVLGTMMLIAHALPVELKIAQKSGPRLVFQAMLRLGSAVLLGALLHLSYTSLGLLQGPVQIPITPGAEAATGGEPILTWALNQVRNLLAIFLIILGLMSVMRALKALRVIDLVNRGLGPALRLLGIGPRATSIAVIGLTLGVSYGGGLIIHEARSGRIDKRDVFYTLTLMGLSHSLIEDTLLMLMMGGHLSGLLWARLAYALLAVGLLVRVAGRLPGPLCDRFLWGDPR